MVRELLSGRIAFPPPLHDSSLAKREAALTTRIQSDWSCQPSSGMSKSDFFDRYIAQNSLGLIECIGARIAYDAAREKLPLMLEATIGPLAVEAILELFLTSVSPSPSSSQGNFEDSLQLSPTNQLRDDPITTLLPHLESLINHLDVLRYVEQVVPIASDNGWESFVESLPVFDSGSESMHDEAQDEMVVNVEQLEFERMMTRARL